MNKNTNAGTGIPANGCNFLHKKNPLFDDKDTTADQKNNSPTEILTIRKWINDNFCSFTDAEICKKFNRTIPELWEIYKGLPVTEPPRFSYFKAPINRKNKQPFKDIALLNLFQAITGTTYKEVTQKYRTLPEGKEKKLFKTEKFDFVTFAGTFTTREITGLKKLSGYGCFDFDHVQEPEILKGLLIADENLKTEMCFTSPSGEGIKLIKANPDQIPYDQFYQIITDYLRVFYPDFAQNIDKSTKDPARACFVCYDPDCFINPQYLKKWDTQKN